jgi:aspartate/glutamate racemase
MTTRLALIHALPHSVAPINDALKRDWPAAMRMNLLDDSLSADLAANGRGLDAVMHERFMRLGDYAVDGGCEAILFTCSAFGSCIEAVARKHSGMPVLKPNEAMIAEAVATGKHVGLLSSFAPTLASMPAEFPASVTLTCELAEGAMAALDAGDIATHDALILKSAAKLAAQGCGVIALAQFSMAHMRDAVAKQTGLPVLTTVDSAVRALKTRLKAA